MDDLVRLSNLIKDLNDLTAQIGSIINRPAQIGHLGEYIAAKIFDITLQESASAKSIDGYFNTGALAKRSVNIKWFLKNDGLMNLARRSPPDFYLVMTGRMVAPATSRGKIRPYVIKYVYLFGGQEIGEKLQSRGVKIGIASSVRKDDWQTAEIYPRQVNQQLLLNPKQITMLKMFGENKAAEAV